MVFQPLLPEVISGTIDMLHAISPIRRLAKRTNLYTREVEAIDLERRVVTLAPELPAQDEGAAVRSSGHRARVAAELRPRARDARARDAVQVPRRRAPAAEPSRAGARGGRQRVRPGRAAAAADVRGRRRRFLRRRVHRRAARLPHQRRCRRTGRCSAGELRAVLVQSAGRILPELSEDLAGLRSHDPGQTRASTSGSTRG